jgi:hypothetical protein
MPWYRSLGLLLVLLTLLVSETYRHGRSGPDDEIREVPLLPQIAELDFEEPVEEVLSEQAPQAVRRPERIITAPFISEEEAYQEKEVLSQASPTPGRSLDIPIPDISDPIAYTIYPPVAHPISRRRRVYLNESYLMLALTGRPLRKGEGYLFNYQSFWSGIAYGITDHFNVMAGISTVPGVAFGDQIKCIGSDSGYRQITMPYRQGWVWVRH